MEFQLDIDEFSLFMLDSQDVPFSKISFELFRITFLKFQTRVY